MVFVDAADTADAKAVRDRELAGIDHVPTILQRVIKRLTGQPLNAERAAIMNAEFETNRK